MFYTSRFGSIIAGFKPFSFTPYSLTLKTIYIVHTFHLIPILMQNYELKIIFIIMILVFEKII